MKDKKESYEQYLKEKRRNLINRKEDRQLNKKAYAFIYDLICSAEKNSELHLMLIYINEILRQKSQWLNDQIAHLEAALPKPRRQKKYVTTNNKMGSPSIYHRQ